jgi:nucleoside-diphosphate-sugar epimerase
LIALIHLPSQNWKPVYNLGAGKTISLLDLAKKIIKIGKIYNTKNEFKINLEEKNIDMKFGMNITSFKKDTKWKPQFTIDDTIHSLFKYDY